MSGIDALIRYASKAFDISPGALTGGNTTRRIARPRQVLMWWAYEHYGFTTERIGQALNRDHTTVVHGVQMIRKLRRAGDELVRELDAKFEAHRPAVSAIRPKPLPYAGPYIPHEYIKLSIDLPPVTSITTTWTIPSPVPPPVRRHTPERLATPLSGPVVIEHSPAKMRAAR